MYILITSNQLIHFVKTIINKRKCTIDKHVIDLYINCTLSSGDNNF